MKYFGLLIFLAFFLAFAIVFRQKSKSKNIDFCLQLFDKEGGRYGKMYTHQSVRGNNKYAARSIAV